MTMFGRDSIFTSLQALPFAPELAAATLRALGARQGTCLDDFRDEDPGRILHEMRYGELTAFEERPHSAYYGCADATPLFVVLMDEYERWTGDTKLVRDLEHEARAALDWIDDYADLQGNGYISYQRRNEETGLENQCWKDSWDSISFGDGTFPGSHGRPASCRATPTTPRFAALAWPATSGATRAGRPPREGRGRPQAPVQPRFLDRGRAVLRRRPRPRRSSGRLADVEHRTPALERHRRQVQGQGGRRPSDGAAALLGLGRAHAGGGRGSLQPDRLPRRDGLAVRQLVHRLGPASVRLQGGGRPGRRGHPGGRRVLRRPAAGGFRRLSRDRHQVPGPDTRRRAVLRRGRRAHRSSSCAPCSGSSRSASTSSSTRSLPRSHRPPRDSSTSPDAGARSTRSPAAGSTWPASPAGQRGPNDRTWRRRPSNEFRHGVGVTDRRAVTRRPRARGRPRCSGTPGARHEPPVIGPGPRVAPAPGGRRAGSRTPGAASIGSASPSIPMSTGSSASIWNCAEVHSSQPENLRTCPASSSVTKCAAALASSMLIRAIPSTPRSSRLRVPRPENRWSSYGLFETKMTSADVRESPRRVPRTADPTRVHPDRGDPGASPPRFDASPRGTRVTGRSVRTDRASRCSRRSDR